MISSKLKIILLVSAVFALGLAGGMFLGENMVPKGKRIPEFRRIRQFPTDDHRTNRLLLVDGPEGGSQKLNETISRIQAYIDKCVKSGDVENVSIYLREMDSGSWAGINENEKYSEASLIKVPIMIAYLKVSEKYPQILLEKLTCEKPSEMPPQNIIPSKSIQPGNAYTVDELLRYMIVYSDNFAADCLMKNLNPELLEGLYSELEAKITEVPNDRLISPKSYSTFFRVLYSVTYLNNEMSEKALNLLLETDFKDGIIAGVPPGTQVAHKFAERAYTNSPEKQLHECGIVYFQKRSYLICVMTRGRNVTILKGVIKEISRLTYEQMVGETW